MGKAPVLLYFWSYSKRIPTVPVVEIGLSPLLLIKILPLLIFLLIHQLKKLNLFFAYPPPPCRILALKVNQNLKL